MWGPSFSNHRSVQSINPFIHSFIHPERPLLKSFMHSGSVEQSPGFSLNSSDEGSVKVVREMCFTGFSSIEIYRAVHSCEQQPPMVLSISDKDTHIISRWLWEGVRLIVQSLPTVLSGSVPVTRHIVEGILTRLNGTLWFHLDLK